MFAAFHRSQVEWRANRTNGLHRITAQVIGNRHVEIAIGLRVCESSSSESAESAIKNLRQLSDVRSKSDLIDDMQEPRFPILVNCFVDCGVKLRLRWHGKRRSSRFPHSRHGLLLVKKDPSTKEGDVKGGEWRGIRRQLTSLARRMNVEHDATVRHPRGQFRTPLRTFIKHDDSLQDPRHSQLPRVMLLLSNLSVSARF